MTDETSSLRPVWNATFGPVTNEFENRRLLAMTPLFEAAVKIYQYEVEASRKRIFTFIWIASIRWLLIGTQFVTSDSILRWWQHIGFGIQAVLGVVIELGGILIILQGRAYYRAARNHMTLCADALQPGDWSPSPTRRVDSKLLKIRTVAIAILGTMLLGDLLLLAWALT